MSQFFENSFPSRILVTDGAIRSIIEALFYNIEFHCSIPPAVTGMLDTHVVTSSDLSGVRYVACATHSETVRQVVTSAVKKAQELVRQASSRLSDVNFTLNIQLAREPTSWYPFSRKTPIVQWKFKFRRTANDVVQLPASAASPASASEMVASSSTLQLANDPHQIREALVFVADKSFDSICTGMISELVDVRKGTLVYDCTIEPR